MRSTQQFSITLTHEMAELVRTKVESGEYASESEVIRDGRHFNSMSAPRQLAARKGGSLLSDAMKANPSRAVSAAKVRASLATAHKSSLRAR